MWRGRFGVLSRVVVGLVLLWLFSFFGTSVLLVIAFILIKSLFKKNNQTHPITSYERVLKTTRFISKYKQVVLDF